MASITAQGATVMIEMRGRCLSLLGACALAGAVPALAHDTPNLGHTHAFEQTGYGSWRQGHFVNGPQGSIIIWSPRNFGGFQGAPSVRFAQPEPITRAPASPFARPRAGQKPAPHSPGKDGRD